MQSFSPSRLCLSLFTAFDFRWNDERTIWKYWNLSLLYFQMNAFRGCTVNKKKKKKDYRLLGRIPAASFLAFTYLHSELNVGMSVLVNFLLSFFFLIFFFRASVYSRHLFLIPWKKKFWNFLSIFDQDKNQKNLRRRKKNIKKAEGEI